MATVRKTIYGLECDQEWDDLQASPEGHHCAVCSKTVIDFTHQSREEVKAYMRHYPNTCGYFTMEQIDPSLTPLGQVFLKPTLVLLGALSLSTVTYQANANTQAKTSAQQYASSGKHTSTGEIMIAQAPVTDSTNTKAATRVTKPKKKKFYISRRFPFLHYGYRRTRLMGCPRF